MKRKRRKHSSEFKVKVALEGAREERTLAQLACEYDMHANSNATWKCQLLEGALGLLAPGEERNGDSEEDTKELLAKIGELTMGRGFSSKALKRWVAKSART